MLLNWHTGAIALIIVSCQASTPANPHYTGYSELPTYHAQSRLLFDDDIGGISLGGAMPQPESQLGNLLSRRILEASTIIVCQIQTITEERAGDTLNARLEFRGQGRLLASPGQAQCPAISVSSQSYSFQLIHHASNALIGKNIVLFLKEFNESGQSVLHWHGEPDGPRIRDEVMRIGSPIH